MKVGVALPNAVPGTYEPLIALAAAADIGVP